MDDEQIYEETLRSNRTTALFVILTLLFLSLFSWRLNTSGFELLSVLSLTLSFFFFFYSLNYRTLRIRMTPKNLELGFGLFRWVVPMENIESYTLDEVSLWRIGGAGIHFTSIRRRYRAMFNFLEYPRVLIKLRKRRGPVRDIAFSTRDPERVMAFLQAVL